VKLSSCLKFTQRIKYLPIGVYRSWLILGPDPPVHFCFYFILYRFSRVFPNSYCSKNLKPEGGGFNLRGNIILSARFG